MKIKYILSFLILMTCWFKSAQAVQIVFFKIYNAKGELVNYEGPYAHSAISFKGQWLHAAPGVGVQLIPSLAIFGPHYILLENENYPEPSAEFVVNQLQMGFNIFADWQDPDFTYCSKLVGQALNVPPTKMHYQSKTWKPVHTREHKGKLGLSPTDVYWYARRNLGFKKATKPKAGLYIPRPTPKTCRLYLGTQ